MSPTSILRMSAYSSRAAGTASVLPCRRASLNTNLPTGIPGLSYCPGAILSTGKGSL
jgi:hypothetical protein